MENRAQGSMEYIMLLGGILLIVVLSIVILRGNVFGGASHIVNQNYETWSNLTNLSNCSLQGC
ncbi:MAG: class III signal peptide-containing protein [Candidatus Micrarchaeota archaeon]